MNEENRAKVLVIYEEEWTNYEFDGTHIHGVYEVPKGVDIDIVESWVKKVSPKGNFVFLYPIKLEEKTITVLDYQQLDGGDDADRKREKD
jgi:hypothetical protein